jgi:hypothetical protein
MWIYIGNDVHECLYGIIMPCDEMMCYDWKFGWFILWIMICLFFFLRFDFEQL